MLPLGWYDDTPKKSTATKIYEAVQAYVTKFGAQPNLILVNERDAGAVYPGCEVRAEKRIGPNIYHVGRQD
jgi:hypothetical protein